jgi:SAM-dependent methyltransferase
MTDGTPSVAGESAWWEALYDDALADLLLERGDPATVDRSLDFLEGVLGLGPGDRVFDQCCGIGSLAVPLARRGYFVVGVDQAARYVERARSAARDITDRVELVVGDARTWAPAEPCAAAFNWYTSFGHSERDTDNLAMLVRAREAVRPGGRFALDFLHLPAVLRDLQRHVAIERGGVWLVRETTLDLAAGFMCKTWRYFFPDGRRHEAHSRLRLYLPHQLVELLHAAGFSEVRLHGDECGAPLELDSPRCIAVAS